MRSKAQMLTVRPAVSRYVMVPVVDAVVALAAVVGFDIHHSRIGWKSNVFPRSELNQQKNEKDDAQELLHGSMRLI